MKIAKFLPFSGCHELWIPRMVLFFSFCLPSMKAGGLQIPCCQGIAVADYSFTLDAIALKPSSFCNVGAYLYLNNNFFVVYAVAHCIFIIIYSKDPWSFECWVYPRLEVLLIFDLMNETRFRRFFIMFLAWQMNENLPIITQSTNICEG